MLTDNTISLYDNTFFILFYFQIRSLILSLFISGNGSFLRFSGWLIENPMKRIELFSFHGQENQWWKSTNRWTCRDTRQLAILLTRYTTLRYTPPNPRNFRLNLRLNLNQAQFRAFGFIHGLMFSNELKELTPL